jgi:hypothetical protein
MPAAPRTPTPSPSPAPAELPSTGEIVNALLTSTWTPVIAAGLVAGYAVSLKLLPWTNCCGGKPGVHHRGFLGWIFFWAWDHCRKCKGTGKKLRWGVRTFRKEFTEQHEKVTPLTGKRDDS